MDGHRRRELILAGLVPAEMKGLEIGPLNRPVVRRSDGDIRYVDYTDTEGLKRQAYTEPMDFDSIEHVDIVWKAQPLAQAVGEPVDYVVASHVIEHVPDLLGWLQEVAAALKPGGVLSLVVPDKRFTFDLRRNLSTIGEVIEASLLGYVRPSIRQVVDHCFEGVVVDRREAWRRDLSHEPLPKIVGEVALAFAYDQARGLAESDSYIDSHCWVFTPQSFLSLLDLLAALQLLPFKVASFTTTAYEEFEFFVTLERVDPGATDEIRQSIARFRAPEPSNAEQRAAALQRSLQEIQSSTSWRITAPLRRLRRRVHARSGAAHTHGRAAE